MSSSVAFGAGFNFFSFFKFFSFGGSITTVVPCTCSQGSQVSVFSTGPNSKFNGTYLYLPGVTLIRGKGNVLPSRQIIGIYSLGGTCMIGAEPYCTSIPITKGSMKVIGTN